MSGKGWSANVKFARGFRNPPANITFKMWNTYNGKITPGACCGE